MVEYPWSDLALNMVVTAAGLIVALGLLMIVSFRARNHSIIDICWGPAFVLVAAITWVLSRPSDGDDLRRAVVFGLTAIWGLRLGAYLAKRNLGSAEDRRYTALQRRRTGGSIVGYLVRKVYGVQGVWAWVISLPLQVAMYQHAELGLLALVGITLWLFGFIFESVGDWQLTRFKALPSNDGKIMDRGLWAWTRHPNYFGDTCVWFGLWFLSLGHPVGLVTVVSPLLMTWLLTRFTGKSLLERGLVRRKGEAYEKYIASTSGFFPMPPRHRNVA